MCTVFSVYVCCINLSFEQGYPTGIAIDTCVHQNDMCMYMWLYKFEQGYTIGIVIDTCVHQDKMPTRACTHICTCIYIYIYTHTHILTHTHTHTYLHVHTHTHTYIYMHAYNKKQTAHMHTYM
jgi:hypothetical protein